MTAREQLSRYLERTHQTQRELARSLRITEAFLSQIMNRHRTPALPTAATIERVTGIPMRDWALRPRGGPSSQPPETTT